MKNFVQSISQIVITAAGTLTSGQGILIGSAGTGLVGVVSGAAAAGEDVTVLLEGVFELPKLQTDDVSQGDKLFWDDGNSRLTLTATSNTFAGYAWADSGTSSDVVLCGLAGSADKTAA